jgi:peptidoglycan/LPS O-acetylase OafA/YrhL
MATPELRPARPAPAKPSRAPPRRSRPAQREINLRRRAPSHIASLEVLRIAASVSVVARHLGPEMRDLLPGGLTALSFLSFVFVFEAGRTRNREFIRSRVMRILAPWLFWCAVYGPILWLAAYPELPDFLIEAPLSRMWIGTTIHLWYLPFVFGFGILLFFASRLAWLRSPWPWLLLLAPICWAHVHLQDLGRPIALWLNALPGLALAGVLTSLDPRDARHRCLIAAALVIAAAVFVPMHFAGIELAYYQLFVFPLIALAWTVRSAAPARLVELGKLTYGVYLIHPLAIWTVLRLVERDSLVALAMVTALSFTGAALLRRTPLHRFV